MPRHPASDPREHSVEVKEVELAKERIGRRGELEHNQTGADPEDPMEFLQPPVEVGQVPHPEAHCGTTEGFGTER